MTETPDSWERETSTEVADCRIFRVREDHCVRRRDKRRSSFFVLENPDWVNVIPLTKEREVVLIEQFRHGVEEILLEIPSGMIDEGEEPEIAGRRELLEETGFTSNQWIFLGKSYPNPAIQNNTIYHYLATDCEKTSETAFDEHESIATKIVPLAEIQKLIANGEFTHSLAVAAFYYLSLQEMSDQVLLT